MPLPVFFLLLLFYVVKQVVNPVRPKAVFQAANVYRGAKIRLKIKVTGLELSGNTSLHLC
jgi:hypothetical protein